GEHDFGAFEFEGAPIMFKIDYYDKDLNFHSPNPADPAVTERVLCAFRRRRPRCPAHGDHVIRSMTTRAAHELDGAVGCIF
ncbi:MAG TPA: DUF3768 domain-containing protein, partial [Bradyrhizobium sp.]|nr:DUF3768 domain-containing protein [Bradyrhizobium sp.]